jgi:hypothetical protein
MKIRQFSFLAVAAFSLAAFPAVSRGERSPTADASTSPADKTAVAPNITSVRWADIKDCSYDARASFFAGLKQLEARVDAQYTELTARRAAMTSTTDTKNWDFAMKEMGDARSFLKSVGDELGNATVETWNQQRDAVGQAWVRTQAAYDKVKSSTTN